MEANIQVLEGTQYRLRVRLTNEAGEQLPPELFRVYAGAFCPGYAPAHFHAERTAEEWVLTMPGLKPGRVPWNWQVIAAEYATGVEWLLAGGEVTVTPRHATGSAAVDPGELKITATLDKTTLQMTVQVGESTSACSLAAEAARFSASAAAASEGAAAKSAADAKADAAAAADARTAAAVARTGAEVAKGAAEVAEDAARVSASEAAKSATAAAASEEAAAEKAALLGDAALCSRNNVFIGGNVFNGPLALNGPLEVTGDFAWGGFPVGWQEDFWLASCGTNPRSKGCKSFSEWMEMNPDWANRRRLLVYIPALWYDDSKEKIYDNIKPQSGGVCEECVYIGKCISHEEGAACWQAFGSRRWFVFSTTTGFRGFGGLRTVEEFTAFLPWVTMVSSSGALDNLGKDAEGCILRLYAPLCTEVFSLFKRCFWTELVLDMPLLDSDFEVGYQAATSSHAVPVVKLAQIVNQLPVRSGAGVRTVTAYVPAAEVAEDAAAFDELVAVAAGKNWSLVYVEV